MIRGDDLEYIRLPAFSRFVVYTRIGRLAAIAFVASAAVLGLLMGVIHASDFVSIVVVDVFVAISLPVLFWLAIREGRRQES